MSVELTAHRELAWDTSLFGFRVAVIPDPAPTPRQLRATLAHLRSAGVTLVYWCADAVDSAALAEDCGGASVGRRATYSLHLSSRLAYSKPGGIEIGEYPDRTSCEELERLAIESGHLSRFRVDPRFPREKFEALYRTWIQRSVSGEIADAVLIARRPGDGIVGFVTVGAREERAEIGLIAVSADMRGRSIGKGLMSAAGDWAVQNDCETCRVVTQGDNGAACRLYERCGYEVQRVQFWYHFWLVGPTPHPEE